MKDMKKRTRARIAKWMVLVVAATAVCWDIAISGLEVQEGTFRYESEFDASSGATTTVSIVCSDDAALTNPVDRSSDPSYEQIEAMVSRAIELQGGLDWVVSKGQSVMLKVNLVGGNSPSGAGENTDVRVVKALMRILHQHTGGEVEIRVAEGTARSNDDPADDGSVWGNSGYLDLYSDPLMEGINFSLVNLNQDLDQLVEVDLEERGTSAVQGSKYHVHRAQLEADVYIAVPVLKIHNTGITNALKLQIGTAPGCYYGYNKAAGTSHCPTGIIHDVGHRRWTTEAIVDLSHIAGIDFVVVDAVMCLHSQKTNKGWNQVRFNTILAGADPVAVDHVGARLMGLNPDDVAHISLAEKAGLGTNDRELITLAGTALAEAAIRVRKSDTEEGRFGQSNRTWTLSPAFETEDFTESFYLDEAAIEPIPGQGGWSEAVYFFDDRIDLHAYYGGGTGILSYAFSYVHAEAAGEAELWLGREEALAVYLNGEEVYSSTSYTPYGDGELGDKVATVSLKEGRNTLLVKSMNKFSDYSFALNICEPESNDDFRGNRVDALKFYLDDSGSGAQPVGISTAMPADLPALQCFPNPATEEARIRVRLEQEGSLSVRICDAAGRLIRIIDGGVQAAGTTVLTWDLTDQQGSRVGQGVYFCSVRCGQDLGTLQIIVQ